MAAEPVPAGEEAIRNAARLLHAGALVAFPTETVYGLGGDATNDRAVAAIFAAKGRPRFNPLIVHVPGLVEAEPLAVFDERARLLAGRFWPGPLTLVLPRRPGGGVSLLASAGLDTVAVRAPAHPVAQRLLVAAARPIAAPSANRSGRVSPTTAAHVAAEFSATGDTPRPPASDAAGPPLSRNAGEGGRGRRKEAGEGAGPALILDGGPCPIGVESTVLDLTGPIPVLLRPGGITIEEIADILGVVETSATDAGAPRSPGRLPSHYAPQLPVRLNATDARQREALLAFGPDAPPGFAEVRYLSHRGDLAEAAASLFAMLRRLDRPEFSGIAVMPIPQRGLGLAINDRLRRAAAPREAKT
ncbi:MAG: L-threonylcarbamoyladenylate synthase [Alphaproteobacteria bacterium]